MTGAYWQAQNIESKGSFALNITDITELSLTEQSICQDLAVVMRLNGYAVDN